jgi:hypothetical protein
MLQPMKIKGIGIIKSLKKLLGVEHKW